MISFIIAANSAYTTTTEHYLELRPGYDLHLASIS